CHLSVQCRYWSGETTRYPSRTAAYSLSLLAPFLPLLFRQTGPCAPVVPLLKIVFEPLIAFGHLLLAKLVAILFLLQHKQQIFLPIALQAPRDLSLSGLHPWITKLSQLIRIV